MLLIAVMLCVYGAAANTPDCKVGTTEVYQPSPGTGKCYCDFGNSGTSGYCNPDPQDEGLEPGGCKKDADEAVGGPCKYYCLCDDAKKYPTAGTANQNNHIKCCKPGATMGLKGGVIIDGSSTKTNAIDGSSIKTGASVNTSGISILVFALPLVIVIAVVGLI